jgi:hypothetical protein
MKKKILPVMMLMIMLLSVGGCYFAVGGYGWDTYHGHDGYYQGYNGSYHGDGRGYYRDHYRGGWHDRD